MPLRSTLPFLLAALFAVGACSDSDPGPAGPDPEPSVGPVLQAEPAYTSGTTNTIAWAIPGGKSSWEFLAQRSATADFADVAEASEWITGNEHVFTDLAHGQTHHFRVRARDEDGSLTPWSEIQSSTQDAEPPTAAITNPDSSQTSLLFKIEVDADDPVSGLAVLELWMAVDGADPVLYATVEPGEVLVQTDRGGRHDFHLEAVDEAGNRKDRPAEPEATTIVPEPIIITDRKGEDFDITNAVLRHGIHQDAWEHGIGRETIRPVIDPLMIGPGHFSYPDDDKVFEVCAVSFGGEERAYRINDMNSREVVDDTVVGTPIAVCY
jgi:hypothetical protein